MTHSSDKELCQHTEGARRQLAPVSKNTGKHWWDMPAPCQSWQVNNSPGPPGTLSIQQQRCSLLPSAQTPAPSLHPQQQLRTPFGITHSAWTLRRWHLPKTLFSSYCYHYSHNWEQVPTADNVHIHVCGCPDYTKSIFHATPLVEAVWATAPMITITVKNLPLVLSQKAWKHGVSDS